MASALKNLSAYDDDSVPSAAELRFGIVLSEWNADITHALYEGCYDTLVAHGAAENAIHTIQVPGSFELTAGAKLLIANKKVDTVTCIFGVLTPDTEAQARERAGGKHGNKGVEAAVTAIRMAHLAKNLGNAEKRIGFQAR